MATMRQFTATFTPCTFTDRGGVSFLLYDPRSKTFSISATTLAGMQDQVRGLLQTDFRMDASVYIRMADRTARKPAGFDKATNEVRHLRYIPPIDANAAYIDAEVAASRGPIVIGTVRTRALDNDPTDNYAA